MPNLYDTPAQSNILNTYVPIPFEEMLQAGQARQGRYDQTLSALQAQEDAIAKLPYVAGGPEEKYMKGVISDIDTLARQAVNKDLSQGMNRRWLQDQLRNKVDVNLLSTITRNKQAYDEARKAEFELRRSNQYLEGYEQENDPYKRGDFQLGQTYDYLPQAMTDPDKILAEYFTNIPEDAYTHIDPKTGQVKNVITKTKAKLLSALENDADTLALNPSMKWMITQYKRNHPEAEDMSDREIISERAKQAIKGNRFTYTKSIDAGFVPGLGNRSDDKIGPPLTASNNTEKIQNVNRAAESIIKENLGFNPNKIKEATDIYDNANFDANGNLTKKIATRSKLAGSAIHPEIRKQAKYDKEYNSQKKIVDTIRQLNKSQFGNLPDSKILEGYVQAYRDLSDVDYNTYLYNPKGGSNSTKSTQTDLITDDIAGRRLVSGETKDKGGRTIENLGDIYAEFGIEKDSKDRKKENIKLTSVVPALGMYGASIEVNGVPKNFMISMNKEEQLISKLAVEANKLNDSGQVGEKKVSVNGKDYYITTALQTFQDPNTGTISYGFGSNIRTVDGKPAFLDPETKQPTNSIDLASYEQFVAAQLNSIY